MQTTHTNTTIWWVIGAIVVIVLVWWAVVANNNNGAGIPNTGVDTASSTDLNGGYANPTPAATSTGNPTMDNAKG